MARRPVRHMTCRAGGPARTPESVETVLMATVLQFGDYRLLSCAHNPRGMASPSNMRLWGQGPIAGATSAAHTVLSQRRHTVDVGQLSLPQSSDMPDSIRLVLAVVDDDPDVRSALRRLLRSHGHDVHAFESAEAYLAADCRADCAILDIQLPGLSGLDLEGRLREAGSGTRSCSSRHTMIQRPARRSGGRADPRSGSRSTRRGSSTLSRARPTDSTSPATAGSSPYTFETDSLAARLLDAGEQAHECRHRVDLELVHHPAAVHLDRLLAVPS